MSAKDINLISFYQDSSNTEQYSDVVGHQTSAPYWDDAVKITSCTENLVFECNEIHGGKEDCVDINNRCNSIWVYGNYYPQGKYCFTVKGGTKNVALSGVIHGGGSEVDVDLGNWSDQSQEITGPVSLNLRRADGKPVRVRVLHATKPLSDLPVEFVFPKPDAWYHGIVVKALFLFFRLTKQ